MKIMMRFDSFVLVFRYPSLQAALSKLGSVNKENGEFVVEMATPSIFTL